MLAEAHATRTGPQFRGLAAPAHMSKGHVHTLTPLSQGSGAQASLSGVPNPSFGVPNQSVPEVPSPRVSLECPTPEYLYQERVGMFEVKHVLLFLFIYLYT